MNSDAIKIWLFSILVVGTGFCITALTVSESYVQATFVFAGLLGVAWLAFAKDAWWLPLPFLLTLGGSFNPGFKIPTYELGLLTVILAVIPKMVFRQSSWLSSKSKFPLSLKLLLFYLLAHCFASLVYNKYVGLNGAGNVIRAYGIFLWPLLFALAFFYFGTTGTLKLGFVISYFASSLRVVAGLYCFYTGRSVYIPGINFFGPGFEDLGETGYVADLRVAGMHLSMFAAIALARRGSFPAKVAHLGILALGVFATLNGAGRAGFAATCFVLLLLLILYRKWFLLLGGGILCLLFISAINFDRELIRNFSFGTQRVLTVFLFDKDVSEAGGDAIASDEFSKVMRKEGFTRWSDSEISTIFGTGIRPFETTDPNLIRFSSSIEFYVRIKNAANTGNYESGFWSIIAVTGIVGFILYISAFVALLKPTLGEVFKHKLEDYGYVFAFIGFSTIVTWCISSYRSGGVPSLPLFYCFLGWVAQSYRNPRKQGDLSGQIPELATVSRSIHPAANIRN